MKFKIAWLDILAIVLESMLLFWKLICVVMAVFTTFIAGVVITLEQPDMMTHLVLERAMTIGDFATIIMPLLGLLLAANLAGAFPEIIAGFFETFFETLFEKLETPTQ